MSAKAAMEQMQVIQSESQRMAREAAVSVPYHRPKQHTLQEFLSRRTILKPVVRPDKAGNVTMGRKKAAAAIKMTPEQLAAYAKQLEEREKEAMEFFKSESDESEKEGEEAKQCDQAADVEMKPAEEQSPNDTAKVPASSEETNLEEQNDPKPTADDVAENVSNGKGPTDNIVAPMDTELGESLRVSDTEDDALDALVNKTSENVDALLASQSEHEKLPTQAEPEPVAGPSNPHPVIDYDPFPEPATSILAQKKAELLKDNSIKVFPTLKGDPNMVIDFDSGDVLPKTPSGPDLLLERFVKCSGKKAHKASSLDILSTDKGTVEISTVKLGLEQEERDPNGKEPVPGAAHMKLKQSLWEKMEQARRDSFLKRQQETYPAKKIDDDEEDEEEAVLADKGLADEYDDEEEAECDEDDDEEVVEGKQCDLLDDEAEVDEDDGAAENQGEESNEDEDEGSSDEESDQESKDALAAADGGKKKSRIIAAFEDSDEENLEKETDAVNAKTVERTTTDELFSTLEGNEKFTPSDRNHLETGENMTLLWKDTEEQESTNAQADEEDLLALCSGRFETTQARPPPSTSESLATTQAMTTTPSDFVLTESDRMTAESEPPITTEALFTQRGDQPVDDSELIALCSGTFATQRQTLDLETEQPLPSEVIAKGKLVIASSDEEDLQQGEDQKRKKKRKRRNLNISDDEEESELEPEEEAIDSADDDNVLEDEEEPERYVDYDSEENEVEVVMTKKDKEKRASAFVENEAELSESEWGSADEDEKDLDRYDMELGDEEKFDQDKLQEELERIHMRRMLEQDKKEVKTLQDMFFEDEEKDGVGRERQFRWRNVETTFSLDYDKKGDEQQKAEGEDSDGETEAQWRKMRFERDMLLKEKKINLDPIDLSESLENERTEDENAEVENNSSIDNQSTLIMQRKITIVRHINTVEASNKPQNSCFLIKKATTLQNTCNASFLARDEETLQRLANLVKVNPETEGLNTATAGKGRNFVFTAVSPAVDKMGSKRSSDAANLNESPSSSAKKMKTVDESPKAEIKSKKRLLLAQLM
ncbi:hypothetical protein RP20_CCG004620 [Aedes albopictus]|nr:hypothetical protein RP20_CCG004620 [Aedes albopictus]